MVNNPPSYAGGSGSIPGWGTKISSALGQLGPLASTTESMMNCLHICSLNWLGSCKLMLIRGKLKYPLRSESAL